MDATDIGKLAEGLAAVGIAALGADPAATAALGVAVPFFRAGFERRVETRELQRRVSDAIAGWARGEHVASELPVGMAIATQTLHRWGLLAYELRELDYDPDRATAEIIRRARDAEPDWGGWPGGYEDAEHVIARRAIRETLSALVVQQHGIEATVLQAIRKEAAAIRGPLHRGAAQVDAVALDLQTLVDQLTAGASVGDLMIYLQRRIEDWDEAPWLGGVRPSQIERRLRVVTRGNQAQELAVSQVLETHRHLVILGGPGAGKSWLARQIARDAAGIALDALKAGIDLSDVEVPLLTTWDAWVKQPTGNARSTLVEAGFSLGLGHGDLGGQHIVERVKRLLRDAPKLLVVVDALDEAKDKSRVSELVGELEGINGWRTVVTSRPAAWDAKSATRQRRDGVAELQPLTWEADVEPFIEAWFRDDPARAAGLITRLSGDTRLRQTATIPLLLTFYCMYARGAPVDSPLPATRLALYEEVVEQLLIGDWTTEEPPARLNHAKQLLRAWAWHAVKDAVTPSGLGDWGETFQPPDEPDRDIARAIDNVVAASVDSRGRRTRMFRHRTLLEYLVAQYIAELSPQDAAAVLLPHLWFDTDWEVAAPMAIAAHPRRNELLDLLVEQARPSTLEGGRAVADQELDMLLLGVASESAPGDWGPDQQSRFHGLRVRYAASEPYRVASSAQWVESNQRALDAVLAALPNVDPWFVGDLVSVLPRLVTDSADGRRALDAVLTALPNAGPGLVADLVDVVPGLVTDSADRRRAWDAVLAALPNAEPGHVADQVGVVPGLVTDSADRRGALDAVLAALPNAGPGRVADLVGLLPGLVTDSADRRHLVDAVLAALPNLGPGVVAHLMGVLPGLVSDSADRRYFVDAVLAALPNAELWAVADLAGVLPGLGAGSADRHRALETVQAALPNAEPWFVAGLVGVLPGLVSGSADRRGALDAVLAALPNAGPGVVADLAGVLPGLGADSADRHRALDAVLAALPNAEPWLVADLVDVLPGLVSDSADRRRALDAVLAVSPNAGPGLAADLVRMVQGLGADSADRRYFAGAVLAALPNLSPGVVAHLVGMVPGLGADCVERRYFADAVLAALPNAEPWDAADLVPALRVLTVVRIWSEWLKGRL